MTAHNHTRFRDLRLPVKQTRRLPFGWADALALGFACIATVVMANAALTTAVALSVPNLPGGGW
jgi:hypothetical protein